MTTLILGIGLGLFVILSLWIFAALIFFISLRIEKKVGIIAIITALIITIILVTIPRTSEKPAVFKDKPYDRLFHWRVILVIILSLSSVIGLFGYIKFELTEPVRPQRISSWIF